MYTPRTVLIVYQNRLAQATEVESHAERTGGLQGDTVNGGFLRKCAPQVSQFLLLLNP